jgi:hypothetical protein
MNRGASGAVQAQWASSKSGVAHLISMLFDAGDGGALRMTDSYRNIVWNGDTYFALGHFLNFLRADRIPRAARRRHNRRDLRRRPVADRVFLQRQYMHRRLLIHKMFLDASEQLVVDPLAIHDGRMDEPRISEEPDGGKTIIEVASRDQFSDFERLSGRHINSTDQRIFFPDDQSFDQLAVFNQRSFVWGRIKEPPATGLGAALTRLVYSGRLEHDLHAVEKLRSRRQCGNGLSRS